MTALDEPVQYRRYSQCESRWKFLARALQKIPYVSPLYVVILTRGPQAVNLPILLFTSTVANVSVAAVWVIVISVFASRVAVAASVEISVAGGVSASAPGSIATSAAFSASIVVSITVLVDVSVVVSLADSVGVSVLALADVLVGVALFVLVQIDVRRLAVRPPTKPHQMVRYLARLPLAKHTAVRWE